MSSPTQLLRDIFGYDTFRPGQAEVVQTLLEGRDALALMPTGGGKSICFQIPAILRDGTGIVISPLIALMTDQVAALQQAGVAAEAIHSARPPHEIQATLDKLAQGSLDLVYVAPERAQTPRFQDILRRSRIALVAIDEAHCVDKWGHDFRQDYLGLHRLRSLTGDAPWFACTATADHRSLDVINDELRLHEAAVFQGSYDRPNIHYTILQEPARPDELADWLKEVHPEHAGIIYCRSRRRTEELATQLNERGIKALAYHAGLPDILRRTLEERFRHEPSLVVCATIAFGMGIDRSDVRFVVHAEPTDSMDAYVQEAGRAGRDGLPASARLYIDGRTIAQTLRNLENDESAETMTKRSRFRAFLGYLETTTCRRQVLLGFFGQAYPDACGNCDNCDVPPKTWDARAAAGLLLEAAHATGQRFGSTHLIQVLLGKSPAKAHTGLSVFGKGVEYTQGQLTGVARHLVARGVFRADRFGGLSIANPRLPPTLLLRHHVEKAKPAPAKRQTQVPAADADLWERLRSTRLEVARAQGVPAFVVFHDSTLMEIAARKPSTPEDLLAVAGVGKAKLQRYGDAFLQVVRDHRLTARH